MSEHPNPLNGSPVVASHLDDPSLRSISQEHHGAFSFSGRARRREYWLNLLVGTLILLPTGFFLYQAAREGGDINGLCIILLLIGLPLLWWNRATAVRRCHDLGWSGWCVLLPCIPYIGWVANVFLEIAFCFLDGQPNTNKYGPNPKSPEQTSPPVTPTINQHLLNSIISGMVSIPGKDYKMGKTEVTQFQWEAIMRNNPSSFTGAENPVENVSWNDCQLFLAILNELPEVKMSGLMFRLPLDAEWEFSCRAGATGNYCKVADGTEITEETLNRVAWNGDNSHDKPHPVAQKEPNAFGLYDMHGNVWEWCQEEIGAMSITNTENDSEHNKITRGGSWCHSAWLCRSSHRYGHRSDTRINYLGIRLCADKRR